MASHSPARREQILTASRALFRTRGYHATTIDEIGETVGVTGPAIYRHFSGKADILVEIFELATGRLYEEATAAAKDMHGYALLSVLIDNHVRFAVQDRDVIAVYGREERNLPETDRRRLRKEQREYVNIWAEALHEEQPNAPMSEIRDRVYALIALIASVGNHEVRSDAARLTRALADMADAAARVECS